MPSSALSAKMPGSELVISTELFDIPQDVHVLAQADSSEFEF